MPTLPDDHELAYEQAYLDRARAELARMREHAESLDAYAASSVESAGVLDDVLARRVASLQDDPHTTLFFGRLDTEAEGAAERWYVGRRHISDGTGAPVVIDWRAPVSTAFYRASPSAPMGVTLRRRFGVDDGRLTAIEDEYFDQASDLADRSEILATEIERPRTGPMRDIVSTIQPEQDEIVRAGVETTICVQGAPGTGKTAVGLHRAAWLLYSFRRKLERTGVLVIGPNRAFLDHIRAVLPALGEVRVRHSTVPELLAHGAIRAAEPTPVAVLKGDERMADVLHHAVWAHVRPVTEPLIVPRGSRKWRVPAYEAQEIVDELCTRGVRYEAARAMLPRRLAHAVLVRMESTGDSPDDRVHDAVSRSAAVRAYCKTVWPALDPAEVLYRLLSDGQTLAAAASGILDEDEQGRLRWTKPPASKRSARWSAADMALLDEIGDQLQRTPSLGHVILDEAQDLSPMQLRAVGRRCGTGSMTVLGDIAQGTTPWATDSWSACMRHLGHEDHHLEVLDRGFRVPAKVLDLATVLLPAMAPGLKAPIAVRDNPGRLQLHRVEAPQLAANVARAVARRSEETGSIGVIASDDAVAELSGALDAAGIAHADLRSDRGDEGDHQVQLVPASVAKGLEFDHVVVVEPATIVEAEPDRRTGLRRLYVVLTRAVSTLTLVGALDLPPELHRDW